MNVIRLLQMKTADTANKGKCDQALFPIFLADEATDSQKQN